MAAAERPYRYLVEAAAGVKLERTVALTVLASCVATVVQWLVLLLSK